MINSAQQCQDKLHKCGTANQVEFEPEKETMSIISRYTGYGPGFQLLGVYFDTKLNMQEAISKLHCAANWKLTRILRSRRYYETPEIINTYKAKLLSYLEYRTPAIFHADATKLTKIDGIQRRLMRELGITEQHALLEYHLAPLTTRRDIAMLGIVHRSVLGLGPTHFHQYFRPASTPTNPNGKTTARRHKHKLETHRAGGFLEVVKNSVLGMVDIYNILPAYVVDAPTVHLFQRRLQEIACIEATNEQRGWQCTYSPRNSIWNNRLHKWWNYKWNETQDVQATIENNEQHDVIRVFAF